MPHFRHKISTVFESTGRNGPQKSFILHCQVYKVASTYPPLAQSSPLSSLHRSFPTRSTYEASSWWHFSSRDLCFVWPSFCLLCPQRSTRSKQWKNPFTSEAFVLSHETKQELDCPTSSSLSDVSESLDAAGLLTGSSCSPESTRFLFANDSSSWGREDDNSQRGDSEDGKGVIKCDDHQRAGEYALKIKT